MEHSPQFGIFVRERFDALLEVGEMLGFALPKRALGLERARRLERQIGAAASAHCFLRLRRSFSVQRIQRGPRVRVVC